MKQNLRIHLYRSYIHMYIDILGKEIFFQFVSEGAKDCCVVCKS